VPRPIHVLQLVDSLAVGGAERTLIRLAVELDPQRFRRSVYLTRPSTQLDPLNRYHTREHLAELQDSGVEVRELDRRSPRELEAWRPLLQYLRRERVQVLHAHKFGSNAWGSVLGRLSRVPVVVAHEQTWSFEGQPLRRLVDRHVTGRLVDAFIAVSAADRRRMIELVGIPAEKIVLIHNGVPPLQQGDRAGTRAAAGIPADAPVLVAVAVLRPQKALDVMLRAVALVRQEINDVHLIIAGGGTELVSLEDLTNSLGLRGAVHLLGSRRDVHNVLAAGDLAVLSSDYEGTPLAVMEYLAAGLPVVATAVGGVPELVHHDENGLLVPPQDPQALASSIVGLLRDPSRRERMGAAGRRVQAQDFSMAAVTQKVSGLYEKLLLGKNVV
jgi:glycosyltransferase involved in cell wall biosynthesis